MKVQSINNQPNFGMKYVNKSAWNPKVMDAFKNSKLFKEIETKYPDAKACYLHMNEADYDIANSEDLYTTMFNIALDKNKFFSWNLSSRTKNIPDKHLIDELSTLTLEEVEKLSTRKITPIASLSVTEVKNPNIFQRMYNKIFG